VADTDSPYKAAYDEIVRQLGSQISGIDQFRTRAGTLISAAALVTSVLGGQVLVKPALDKKGVLVLSPISVWGWLAIACFVGVGIAALYITWPKKWGYGERATTLVRNYQGRPHTTLIEAQLSLAKNLQAIFDENERKLIDLSRALQLGILLLTAETVFWLIDLRV
jgi:hypothetical protein